MEPKVSGGNEDSKEESNQYIDLSLQQRSSLIVDKLNGIFLELTEIKDSCSETKAQSDKLVKLLQEQNRLTNELIKIQKEMSTMSYIVSGIMILLTIALIGLTAALLKR